MHIHLIVLFFAMVIATEIKVHHVTDIYTGKHEGDLFLQLNRAVLKGRKPHITQIDWCGSTQLNPLPGSKIVVREVKDCTEPGLLHARLFPSETRKVNQPHDAPDRLFINADFIGGWNSRRQGMIIVNVDIAAAATGTSTGTEEKLIQKFRINPINVVEETNKAHHTQQPVDIVSEETIALPIVHETQQQKPPQVVETQHLPVASVVSVASVSPSPSLTIASSEGEEEEELSALSDWKGMLYLFASGMAAIILIVGATMVKRGTLSIPFLSARLNRHRHTRLAQNDVEMDDFGTHSMSSLIKDDSDDDVVVVDEYTNILMQLGTGATPAFKDNL